MPLSKEQREELWNQEGNWNKFLYFCKDDDRVLVPKKRKWMGYTLNLGHPQAPLWILFTISVATIAVVVTAKKARST